MSRSWHMPRLGLPLVCLPNIHDPFSQTPFTPSFHPFPTCRREADATVAASSHPAPCRCLSKSPQLHAHNHHFTDIYAATGCDRVCALACADCGVCCRDFFGAHAASAAHRHCAQHAVGRHELASQLLALQPPPPPARPRGACALSACVLAFLSSVFFLMPSDVTLLLRFKVHFQE